MYVYFWVLCFCSIDLCICLFFNTILSWLLLLSIVSINIGSWYFLNDVYFKMILKNDLGIWSKV